MGKRDGMCPTSSLDFRVLGKTMEDTEFVIIAALQFIRYLNDRNDTLRHGANLSIDSARCAQFRMRRTPICHECERLVDSGVWWWLQRKIRLPELRDEGGGIRSVPFSITDPG
jgi:hypothetical protein